MGETLDTKLLKKVTIVLKELREAKNVTQADVYNDTNVHIGRIETGKVNVSVSTLSVLCKYFKVKMSEFHKRVEEL
jgi:transcriptional regulator with XRE-family HTH domain